MTVNEMCNIWNGLRPAEGFAFQLGSLESSIRAAKPVPCLPERYAFRIYDAAARLTESSWSDIDTSTTREPQRHLIPIELLLMDTGKKMIGIK